MYSPIGDLPSISHAEKGVQLSMQDDSFWRDLLHRDFDYRGHMSDSVAIYFSDYIRTLNRDTIVVFVQDPVKTFIDLFVERQTLIHD